MENMGDALMGTGTATGEYRAAEAAQNAISSPLLEGISINGSEAALINITASSDMTMMEVDEAVKIVHEAVGADANIIFGVVLEDTLEDAMMVTVIATGFNKTKEQRHTTPQQRPANVQAQPAPQPVAQPQPQQAQRPMVASREILTDHVPVGLDELEKYNEPAYLRRGTGIHRGGYDITRKQEEPPQKPEEEQIEEQKEVKRQAADKPAFLRRIMD
jgi:hypothetical protein